MLLEATYKAKQVVYPLGFEVQKIHACPNDYVLYHNEYEDLDAFLVCKASRYKIKCNDPSEAEGEPKKKRPPAKVMWYPYNPPVEAFVWEQSTCPNDAMAQRAHAKTPR